MKKAIILLAMFSLVLAGCNALPNATPTSTPGPAAPSTASETPAKAASPGVPTATEVAYVGLIGDNLGIHMRLTIQDGKVSGSYYYDSVKENIVLKGNVNGPQLRIEEYDANGKSTGTFYGAWVAADRIEGAWAVSKPEQEGHYFRDWIKIHPFYLQVEGRQPQAASTSLATSKEAWEGTWRRPASTEWTNGAVRIFFVTDKSFWFEMFRTSGASSGSVRAVAVFEEDGAAVFKDGRGGELRFTRKGEQLVVKANEKMSYYAGYGVFFDGELTRGETRQRTFYQDTEVLVSAQQEELFKKMTGKYYERFISYFHLGHREESLDGPGIKAFSGYVRGLAPYYQCIVMRSDEGALWAAMLTFVDSYSAIIYFASDGNADSQIPKTIEKWMESVQEKHTKKLEIIRYQQQ